MAKKKFTELPAATTPLAGTEIIAIVQGGVSKQTTVDDLPAGGVGGTVDSVVGGQNIAVDSTDPANPIVSFTSTLTETQGGTAQSSYAQGDIIYAVAVDNLGKRNIGANGTILTSDGSAPQWSDLSNQNPIGVQDLFISASAMWPRTTNPCSDLTKTEIATSLFNI